MSTSAFISWSGQRELLIARALQRWLAAGLPGLRTFVSPELPKGRTWFEALARELQGARIGFMCLAPPRGASAWQLVEAGAIWKAARRGGLFPITFALPAADVPEPLRSFQLTRFERDDFRRLGRDVAALLAPGDPAAAAEEQAFEAAWPALEAAVAQALAAPDDGVYTAPGFVHEIAGGWWERVTSDSGATRLSWMWIEPAVDGYGQSISGIGFDDEGREASRWETELVAVDPRPPRPLLSYYWEGRHPERPALLFGGKGWVRFDVERSGRILKGRGEFWDVCLSEAQPPRTKLIDLRRASDAETRTMRGDAVAVQRSLAQQVCQAWG